MAEIHILILLFIAALASSTILPAQGELVLFALLATKAYSGALLLVTACVGCVIGTGVNWVLGRYITRFEDKPWFPVKRRYLNKAQGLFAKHGRYTLLLAGVPLLGDAITITAGILKINFWVYLLVASTARSARYVLVWGLYEGIF